MSLPAPAEVLDTADNHFRQAMLALSAARDELLSDTSREYTTAQAERKRAMFAAIGEAKAAIEAAWRS